MKLFQQLLVAPAALGLLAPVAVSAAELTQSRQARRFIGWLRAT